MGRRKFGLTQAEQKQYEKSSFMDGRLSQFNELLTQYFLSQGHLILPKDIGKADASLVTPVAPHIEQFYHAQRLVRDGGPLTGKRKEVMLETIYAMERLVAAYNPPHELSALYQRYKSASSWASGLAAVAIISGLIGLAVPAVWVLAAVFVALALIVFFQANSLKRSIKESAISIVTII